MIIKGLSYKCTFEQPVPSGIPSSTGGSDFSGNVLDPGKMGTGHEQAAKETLATNHEWTELWLCRHDLNHELDFNAIKGYI